MFTALEIKILGALLLLAAVLTGVWIYNKHEQEVGAAIVRTDQLAKDLATAKADRDESDRRVAAQQEKANAADQQASAARADLVAAHSAGDRLRVRLAAAERARGGNPPAAGASAPADDAPQLVSFDVFERVRGAAEQLGGYADDLRIHLDACIGSYESLTPNQPPKGNSP